MYLKTTSPQFLKFGIITDAPSSYPSERISYEGKSLENFFSIDCEVYIKLIEGIAILVVENEEQHQQFVIHRSLILNANVPFTIVPLTQSALVEISYQTSGPVTTTKIDNNESNVYEPIRPQFEITDIYSYYYNVKGKGYNFSGESHFYWELTYVDTGEIEMVVDDQPLTLKSQDLILFLPGQFHKQYISGNNSSSYLTIMFDMNVNLHLLDHLENRVVHCSKELYELTQKFIHQTSLLETGSMPYSRDLLLITLKEMIVNLLQIDHAEQSQHEIINPIQAQFENELLNEINNYIHKNIYEPISVEDLCSHFAISRSTLQSLFKKYINEPPKKYINDLKMAHAQRLILEGKRSITEVSLKLGFTSIHYFSRKFKAHYGMSPSEYLQSVYRISKGTEEIAKK